ncbi:protein kinase domain-containing protein [Pantanalinema sp. GBBB05]|uniref:protein kinase domain-containing protein n=1 Tax=Pantanalinema sp. GBBB05 TaxID=2604139 RepID=UPI001DE607B3|nr:protein kinase [Pantanalinema sp. GBBB05]
MSLCINPHCAQPDHPGNDDSRICQSCGSDLVLQGRYRVMRVLSDTTGFGIVYEAYEHTTPKILKALKAIHNHNAKAVELFRQEAEVLSRIHSLAVPKIGSDGYFQMMPKGQAEPVHCIVMEKIDGLNLSQWMQQQGDQPINERQALNWLQQLAEVLHQVHQQNYFHRDIKPQNIMLRSTGQLVLIDFGTARQMTYTYLAHLGNSSITQISSPGYTPPEQDMGHAVPQSDFYALGRTFVYLLTGVQLTDGSIYDAQTGEIRWRQYAPHVSRQFADFLDRLIAPRPIDRPKNTQEILAELQRLTHLTATLQTSTPVTASTLPPWKAAPFTYLQDVSPPTQLQRSRLRQGGVVDRISHSDHALTPITQPTRAKRWLLSGAIATILGLIAIGGWQGYRFMARDRVEQPIVVTTTLAGHTSYVNVLALSPDGETLISGSADKTIKLWDLATGQELQTLTGHTSFVNALAVSPDGSTLVSGSADRTIRVWDLATGKQLRVLMGHTSFINALAITADGETLVSASADRTIKLWNLATGQLIRTLVGHTSFVNTLAISSDDRILASGSADKTIKLWNLTTGQLQQTLMGHDDYVNAIVITPDGKTLISGSADKTIKLWDLAIGKELQTLTGHTGYVMALAVHPNGKTLASSSSDGSVKLWDLTTGKVMRTFTGYGHHIDYFVVSSDWQTIATGSSDRVIKAWNLNAD